MNNVFSSILFVLALAAAIGCNDKPDLKPNSNEMLVYPNPALHSFNIFVPNQSSKNFDLKVFDTRGKVILDKSETQTDQHYRIDISDKPTGSYHIVLIIGNTTITKELLKP